MISLFDRLVIGGPVSLPVAVNNMRLFLEALADPISDNIAVDVKGPIFLAPYNNINILSGGNPGNNVNIAIKCLTFDYGASLATHPLAGTTIEINNFQIEADEKAFLFETINETTQVEVADLYNSEVSVCWFGAVADGSTNCLIPHSKAA